MCNMSVDCDCARRRKIRRSEISEFCPPWIRWRWIRACIDLVYQCEDPGKKDLIERIESRHGIHTIEAAAELGIGSREYELIDVDQLQK